MAFSPDGTLLACAGIRGEEGHPEYRPFPIWLLDGRTAQPSGVLAGHDGPVKSLHFSPSGGNLASVGSDGVVCVWNISAKKPLWHRGSYEALTACFTDDGKHVVVMDKKWLFQWLDAVSGAPLREIDDTGQETIPVPPDADQSLSPKGPRKTPAQLAEATAQDSGKAVPSSRSIMRYDSNHRLRSVVTTEAEIALVDIALKQNPWESWTVLSVFSTPESVTVKRRHAVVGAGSAIYYRDIFAPVNPMATFFLPGGKAVCAWSAEDGLRVQDTFTGKKLAADDSTAPPKVAAILRGGKVVAVLWPSRDPLSVNIGAEDSVALIETDSRKVLRTIEAAPREGTVGYRSVAFSPDGKRAAVIGHSGRDQTHVRIVDCSTGRTVKEFLALHETRKTEFDVRSNENAVEVLTPDEVRESEFDGRSFERAPEAREPTVVRGAFSPNGRRLAIEIEGEIRIWNVETAEEVSANPGPARPQDRSVEEHQGTVYALVFSPDAAMLATLSNDATTRLWDTRSGKELFRWAHKLKWSMADSVAFSPDSKTLAIDLGGGRIEIRRCSDGTCLHRLDEPLDNGKTLNHTGPSAVAFSPDGRQLAVWPCSDRTLIWWDAQSGRRLGETHVVTSENDRPISTVYRSASTTVLSPGLRWIGSLEYLKHSLLVWDSQTGRRQYRLTQEGPFGSHRFSPDGRLLAFGMQGGNIRIVDVTSAQTVREFECDAEQSFPRTFLDDGRILVSTHDDRTTRFWDVVGGREIFRLDGIRIRACSRDGRYAASVAKPDYIRRREGTQVFSRISIWDLRLAKSKSEEQ